MTQITEDMTELTPSSGARGPQTLNFTLPKLFVLLKSKSLNARKVILGNGLRNAKSVT
jgi:hypothetical protein